MLDQNTTYSNHSMDVGDRFIMEMSHEMITNYSGIFHVTNVLLDLFSSLFAILFTFKFYQRIEISHPLYAVIFMDIVISTATSLLAIILSLVNSFLNSVIIVLVNFGLSSISALNNVSSFVMIACIRYYLLVHLKTNENKEEVDMIKVKNISLIMNCVIFIIILLIRGSLYTVRLVGYDVQILLRASGLCLIILPLVTTLILNRKIDNFLNTIHDQNNMNANIPSTSAAEDKPPLSREQRLGDRRVSKGKRERRNLHI